MRGRRRSGQDLSVSVSQSVVEREEREEGRVLLINQTSHEQRFFG
jgi:hypothetical protein